MNMNHVLLATGWVYPSFSIATRTVIPRMGRICGVNIGRIPIRRVCTIVLGWPVYSRGSYMWCIPLTMLGASNPSNNAALVVGNCIMARRVGMSSVQRPWGNYIRLGEKHGLSSQSLGLVMGYSIRNCVSIGVTYTARNSTSRSALI